MDVRHPAILPIRVNKISSNGCENVDTCGNSYKLSVFDWLSNVAQPTSNQCHYVEVRFKNDRKAFIIM